ncbi:MAG: GNAT family N-acetyltransferase [Clostridia bacterium]|nr:GNAT family N-acetyltransferase [Clostridia bacterium]
MRFADKKDILQLSKVRVEQQKDDWQNKYKDKNNLLERTEQYLKLHLNKDLYIIIEEVDNMIIATCGLQVINYLPQCNDNGKEGFICNVFTKREQRNKGIQTMLLKEILKFSKEQNLCEIKLLTDSKEAISLYKKFGFEFDDYAMKLILN